MKIPTNNKTKTRNGQIQQELNDQVAIKKEIVQ